MFSYLVFELFLGGDNKQFGPLEAGHASCFTLDFTYRDNFLAFSIVVFADIGSIFSEEGKTNIRKFSKNVLLHPRCWKYVTNSRES